MIDFIVSRYIVVQGRLAQLVERNIDVVEVRGSNPLSCSFLLLLNSHFLILHFKLLMIFVSGSIAYDTIISTVGTFDSSRRGDDKYYSYSLYAPRVIRQA